MAQTESNDRQAPVIYSGRRASQMPNISTVDDWHIAQLILDGLLDDAPVLAILDPLSFPFELVEPMHWDIPIVLDLPKELASDELIALFGSMVFERLVFFDSVVVTDQLIWSQLRDRYSWGENQRLGGDSADVGLILAHVHNIASQHDVADPWYSGTEYEPITYWRARGKALARSSPNQAVCSVHHGLRSNKAMHRAQAAVFFGQIALLRNELRNKPTIRVLEVGCGIGRWATAFDPRTTEFHGVDISEHMIEEASRNFPWHSFATLEPDLDIGSRQSKFDLAFTVAVMHHNTPSVKRKLISEMWRVTRPGGKLAFMEQFVAGSQSTTGTVYPMSVTEFIDICLDASNGRLTLEHVESIRYPYENVHKTGLLVFRRIG
jgi:SAM-dependent methyltransferase